MLGTPARLSEIKIADEAGVYLIEDTAFEVAVAFIIKYLWVHLVILVHIVLTVQRQ